LDSLGNLAAESWQFCCHIVESALPFGIISGR